MSSRLFATRALAESERDADGWRPECVVEVLPSGEAAELDLVWAIEAGEVDGSEAP